MNRGVRCFRLSVLRTSMCSALLCSTMLPRFQDCRYGVALSGVAKTVWMDETPFFSYMEFRGWALYWCVH